MIFGSTVVCSRYPAVRGNSLAQNFPDESSSKEVCVDDVFSLDTEREPGIRSRHRVEGLILLACTADSGSSGHVTPNQRGDVDL